MDASDLSSTTYPKLANHIARLAAWKNISYPTHARGMLLIIIHQIFSLACDWSKGVTWPNIPQHKTGEYPRIFPNFENCARCEKDLKDNKDNILHLGRKYARIFVRGHYLFRSSYCVIVWVRVVLKRTVVGDWRFDNLSGSHLQSQVNSICQSMML